MALVRSYSGTSTAMMTTPTTDANNKVITGTSAANMRSMARALSCSKVSVLTGR